MSSWLHPTTSWLDPTMSWLDPRTSWLDPMSWLPPGLEQLHHRGGVDRGPPHRLPLHPDAGAVAPAHLPRPRGGRGGPGGGPGPSTTPPGSPRLGDAVGGPAAVGLWGRTPQPPKAWWEVACKSHANELPRGLMGAEEAGNPRPPIKSSRRQSAALIFGGGDPKRPRDGAGAQPPPEAPPKMGGVAQRPLEKSLY